ncbi:alkaline phosphatase [Planococcus lenghuensis]|uniref:Alkaline phosphatase n=1 Tax=Planococcus lenghuensis TaxID=2213202 RepID=A0A1Q2KVR3_9BACL|nr:alkaline phosphatase [Planococcus lenghuensis]AQQ52279.1 alkaline phosphatase [Planococcus lenghuensis]
MKYKLSKKAAGVSVAAAVAISSFGFASSNTVTEAKDKKSEPTNVIMMVKDGTSAGATTLARWYKGEDLAMDEILVGGMHTHSAESAITDSAPAGTAMATGHKANDKVLGLLPAVVNTPGVEPVDPEDALDPVANVLEGAELLGKSTGIISTSEIQHATPAAFSAHAPLRYDYDDIAEQQVYQDIEVVLGGGKASLAPGEGRNARKDGENLLEVIDENGYDFVETKEELLNSTSDKLWGSFAPSALAYDFDRQAAKDSEEPSLADMTAKGIETLSKDEDGFFMFVEGSKVDWAAHANDPIGIISDVLAFDEAVAEAVEFAKEDGNTMVIVVSDHGNSGITMGNVNTSGTYSSIPVSAYIDPLKKAELTVEGALSKLKEDRSNMEEVAALYGLDNLTANELEALKAAEDLGDLMADMLSERANLGFTTGGHTGEDVFLYAYGPSKPMGLVDNTDLAGEMAEHLGFDLVKVTDELFVNAKEAFEQKGFTTRIDDTDAENVVFVAEKDNIKIELPENKDLAYVTHNKKSYEKTLDGVTVFNGSEFFVSQIALNMSK